jgi:hypothetical protein
MSLLRQNLFERDREHDSAVRQEKKNLTDMSVRLLVLGPTQRPAVWYARGDSNSRTRLRRPVLYPLSYGRIQADYSNPAHGKQK